MQRCIHRLFFTFITMKKFTILFGILLSVIINAQIPVWINTFDNANDLQGWTFYDGNGNNNQWMQGPNIYYNGTALAYGNDGSLRHSISLVPTGAATNFATENDWVISPEINLAGASGTIQLVAMIGRQRTTHTFVSRHLWIYVSTPSKPVPSVADFQAMTVDGAGNDVGSSFVINGGGTSGNPWPADLSQSVQSNIVDLSAFAGQKIYIGIWSNRKTSGVNSGNNQNINIGEMGIYASTLATLATQDTKIAKNLTQVRQNPVTNSLQLKLNPKFKANTTLISVYNMAGQKVLTSKYAKDINVTALSAGTYITTVSDGNSTDKVKFIKK